jgi:hypothetical protein
MPQSPVPTQARAQLNQRPQRELAGSKSLASMLPTLLTSGVITLAVTAILRLVWLGFGNDFFAAWMEAWLTTWPIAFPLAYMSKPLIYRLANRLSSPVFSTPTLPEGRNASSSVSAKNPMPVDSRRMPRAITN